MSEQDPTPPSPITPNDLIIKDAIKVVPFGEGIKAFFIREGKPVKEGWLVFCAVLALGVWLGKYLDSGQIDKLNVKISDAKDKLNETKGALNSMTQDRDKYEVLLAPFEAAALKLNTNVPTNERLDLFASQLTSISTNVLNAIDSERPYFELKINGKTVHNGDEVSLKGMLLQMKVLNKSQVAADNLRVTFELPGLFGDTNLIHDSSWNLGSRTYLSAPDGSSIITNIFYNCWNWGAHDVLPSGSPYIVNPLEFSTNIPFFRFEAYITIYASRSTNQQYTIDFDL